MRRANDVAVSESYVLKFTACRFKSKLTGPAPFTAQNTVFHENVGCACLQESVYSLNDYRIVKGMDEGVFNTYALTVYNVYSVGVISPFTEDLDAVYLDVKAMEDVYAPDSRICESDTLYFYISTVVKLYVSRGKGHIAMLKNSFLCGVVKYSVTENVYIFSVFSKDISKDERVRVNVYAFV